MDGETYGVLFQLTDRKLMQYFILILIHRLTRSSRPWSWKDVYSKTQKQKGQIAARIMATWKKSLVSENPPGSALILVSGSSSTDEPHISTTFCESDHFIHDQGRMPLRHRRALPFKKHSSLFDEDLQSQRVSSDGNLTCCAFIPHKEFATLWVNMSHRGQKSGPTRDFEDFSVSRLAEGQVELPRRRWERRRVAWSLDLLPQWPSQGGCVSVWDQMSTLLMKWRETSSHKRTLTW